MSARLLKRIYYHDTDCGGVVYYANYLKYFEEGRTELLRERGIDLKVLAAQKVLFAVKNTSIEYKSPARYADEIEIITQISKVKNASLEFAQQIQRGDSLLVLANTVLVCIDSQFKPCVIPTEINSRLTNDS